MEFQPSKVMEEPRDDDEITTQSHIKRRSCVKEESKCAKADTGQENSRRKRFKNLRHSRAFFGDKFMVKNLYINCVGNLSFRVVKQELQQWKLTFYTFTFIKKTRLS